MKGTLLLVIAKIVYAIFFKRLDADNRRKLFDLEEEKRQNKAIEAGETYIRMVTTGTKNVEGLLPLLTKIMGLVKVGKKQKRVLRAKLKKTLHFLGEQEEKFFKFNN